MVHITEQTLGRRYAGWFIRNTEHAQRVYDGLKNAPLPTVPTAAANATGAAASRKPGGSNQDASKSTAGGGKAVAWGGAKMGA